MTAPLTLIVEGKPLVFDVPVPVGTVLPGGSAVAIGHDDGTWSYYGKTVGNLKALEGGHLFTARPPAAPASFVDGDVAWVRFDRAADRDWYDPHSNGVNEFAIRNWLAEGLAILPPSPRPESLADVLDDLGLTDEQRARVEKAVGA